MVLVPREGKHISAVEVYAACPDCKGTGEIPGVIFKKRKRGCPRCQSTGVAKGWVSIEYFARQLLIVMNEMQAGELKGYPKVEDHERGI